MSWLFGQSYQILPSETDQIHAYDWLWFPAFTCIYVNSRTSLLWGFKVLMSNSSKLMAVYSCTLSVNLDFWLFLQVNSYMLYSLYRTEQRKSGFSTVVVKAAC